VLTKNDAIYCIALETCTLKQQCMRKAKIQN
jgi:hypothetical protein